MQVTSATGTAATSGCGTQGSGSTAEKNEYKRAQKTRRDKVSISRRSPRVKRLQNQRKQLGQRKQRLVRRAKQNGESISTIRTKLIQYEAKMKMLQQQIALAVRQEAKEQVEKALRERGTTDKKLRPDEEYARLAKEAGLTTSLSVSRSTFSGKARAKGEAGRMEKEIREAERRGDTPREEIGKKKTRLRELEEKAKG